MKTPYALILLVAASTAYGQIDNPPTPSSIGLGTTNDVAFNKISLPAGGGTNDLVLQLGASNTGFYVFTGFGTPAVFVHNDAQVFAASTGVFALYKPLAFVNPTNAAITRTNLGLGATNNVTFSNITASGTLAVTGDTVLSGVNNTMPNATNAASASSLMTRDLLFRAQADDNSGDLVAMVGNTTNGGTGAIAAVNNVFGANAQVSTNSNSVAGVYFADNIWANSTVGGAVVPSGKTIDLTMKGVNFRNLTNTSYVTRVVAGVGTPFRTIPAAGQDALSARGWGVNFFYNGTNHVFQPFWYTTNYNTGPQTVVSNATANDSIFALRLRHVGPTTNGTISFWINDGLASRLSETPSFSTNVGNWGGNFVGRHYAIESATATNAAPASTTSIRVRAAYIKYEP